MGGYIFLAAAIVLELFSTSMLKASVGFTRIIPSVIFLGGMGASFYALSKALTCVPLSVAYAIWSGIGTAITAVIAVVIWKESLNIYTIAGISLIIAGVVLLNLKSSVN